MQILCDLQIFDLCFMLQIFKFQLKIYKFTFVIAKRKLTAEMSKLKEIDSL